MGQLYRTSPGVDRLSAFISSAAWRVAAVPSAASWERCVAGQRWWRPATLELKRQARRLLVQAVLELVGEPSNRP